MIAKLLCAFLAGCLVAAFIYIDGLQASRGCIVRSETREGSR